MIQTKYLILIIVCIIICLYIIFYYFYNEISNLKNLTHSTYQKTSLFENKILELEKKVMGSKKKIYKI